jgi:hypothetical protein
VEKEDLPVILTKVTGKLISAWCNCGHADLLLDEASTGLDAASEETMIEA